MWKTGVTGEALALFATLSNWKVISMEYVQGGAREGL
jgi:hypothetical protein